MPVITLQVPAPTCFYKERKTKDEAKILNVIKIFIPGQIMRRVELPSYQPSCFIDEETEAQRSHAVYLESQGYLRETQGMYPSRLIPYSIFSYSTTQMNFILENHCLYFQESTIPHPSSFYVLGTPIYSPSSVLWKLISQESLLWRYLHKLHHSQAYLHGKTYSNTRLWAMRSLQSLNIMS